MRGYERGDARERGGRWWCWLIFTCRCRSDVIVRPPICYLLCVTVRR